MTRFGTPREGLGRFVELFALTGLLIAQPVLNFLGNNAQEVTIFRLSLRAVLVFLVLLLLVPPAVLWLVEMVVGLAVPRLRRAAHAFITCSLVGVIAGNYLKTSTHVGAGPRILVSVVAALLAALVTWKTSAVAQWLRFLAIAPLIFGVLFVTATPISVLLFQHVKTASVTVAHPVRVVMIVFDEFPEESLLDGTGHVDAQLFPNFAKLAAGSTWYQNDTTVAEFTPRAVPAILTGRYPPLKTELPIAKNYPQSLFTLLAKTYQMHAHEFYEQLCPITLCYEPTRKTPVENLVGTSADLMHNLMDLDRRFWDGGIGFRFGIDNPPGLPPALSVGQDFLNSLRPSTKPTLDYLHVLLPHQPWQYLAGGKDHGKNPNFTFFLKEFPEDKRKIGLGREMHLLQVQATDWYLGEVMSKLKAIGAYDNSLIVVTADHGVTFPYFRYALPNDYDHIMWTPLFIKAPQQTAGSIDRKPTLSIDVLPTMADILGVKIPWKIDGQSLLGPRRKPGPVTIVRNNITGPGHRATFDGPAGFAKVLKARASPWHGDVSLRLYRIGFYGGLIGQPAGPLIRGSSGQLRGTLSTPGGWNSVNPNANYVPWTVANGTVTGVKVGTIAIAVNGRIGGTAVITSGGQYDAMLVPKFFRSGKNDVTAYLVTGARSSPTLTPIASASPGASR